MSGDVGDGVYCNDLNVNDDIIDDIIIFKDR